ncbi:MAG: RagB/SusD family nutrient uptake outer membrane protein [Muribaculaceae bacterium]|nr:RagB/SusD family nutrient uptake outer membrane protein [Muribaculaceae bacterium]
MKFYNIFAIAALAIGSAACSNDFLQNAPQGSLSDAVMGSSEGAELLCNAAYAALGGPEGQSWSVWCTPTSNWSYGEVRSDNAYKGGGGTGDINEVHRMEVFDVQANNGNLDSKWFHLYCSLQRCNSALNVLQNHSDSEIANRKSRIGEMRVLRAHFFFELSRLFNKVPYFDENVATPDYVNIPNDQFSRDEILGKIYQELNEAAAMLPEKQDEIGRINKFIALAYAAKVRLYQAYKQDETTHKVTEINKSMLKEVVTLVDQVLQTGRYKLLSDYQQLDLIAHENDVESVFAIQYSMNDGTPDAGRVNWSNLLNSPGGNSPYHGDGFFLPSQDLINAYQTDENGLPIFNYQDLPDFSEVEYIDDENIVLHNADRNVDPRLDFVVGRPTITWKTYTDSPCQSWVRDRGTYGHNCIKRFWVSPESPDMFPGWPWGASHLNWQIIRTVDLMLWKAEALIEIGEDISSAIKIINEIRTRVKNSTVVKDFRNPEVPAANYKIGLYAETGLSQDYARKALRTETRLEKAFEGERFFDLVRWGILGEVMPAYLNAEKDNRIYYNSETFTAQRDEYLPIPINQINFSGGLYKQNPGFAQ